MLTLHHKMQAGWGSLSPYPRSKARDDRDGNDGEPVGSDRGRLQMVREDSWVNPKCWPGDSGSGKDKNPTFR